MNAFYLHDALHGTNLATRATETWQSTVENDGLNRVPDLEKNDNNYFNLDYLIHPLGIWEPIGESHHFGYRITEQFSQYNSILQLIEIMLPH